MLRIVRLIRIIDFLDKISNTMKKSYMLHQVLIDNIFHILRTLCVLAVSVHCLVCSYIAIGHVVLPNDLDDPWLVRLGLDDNTEYAVGSDSRWVDKNGMVYLSGVYLITTTITTVGYGEYSGGSIPEKFYMMFVIFFGILIFSVI